MPFKTITVLLAGALAVSIVAPAMAQSPGEALYKSKCQACHGPDGSGDTVMGKKLGVHDLRSAEIQKQTDAQLTESIVKGKGKMKGFQGKLAPADIKALVGFIRAMK